MLVWNLPAFALLCPHQQLELFCSAQIPKYQNAPKANVTYGIYCFICVSSLRLHLHVSLKGCHYFLTINTPTAEVLVAHGRRLLQTFIGDTAGNFGQVGTSEDLDLHAVWKVSRTLLLLSLSWQQPNRMQQCCVFFLLMLVLMYPDPLLRNTWSLRSGQRVCARRADRVGRDRMSWG